MRMGSLLCLGPLKIFSSLFLEYIYLFIYSIPVKLLCDYVQIYANIY